MEQKKIQRIIGIVVVIALVIVVIPLLFGKNDFPMQEASNIKAPPFPDQQQSTDASANTQSPAIVSNTDINKDTTQTTVVNSDPVSADKTSSTVKLPEPAALSGQIEKSSPDNKATDAPKMDPVAATNPAESDKQSSEPPVGSIIYEPASVSTPDASNSNTTAATPMEPATNTTATTATTSTNVPATNAATPAVSARVNEATQTITLDAAPKANEVSPVATSDISAKENESSVVATVKPVTVKEKHTHLIATKATHAKAKSTSMNSKFIAPGWVIQMGNFSVRKNAINLTNRLQAAGYKAFAQDVKSPNGKTFTRVYIGPEFKQASAAQISNNVNQKLNLKGFVTSYKNIS